MDYLRQGIHLRGYAQKDYRYEYKREAFEMFQALLERVKYEVVSTLARVEVRTQEQVEREETERRERLMQQLQAQHADAMSALAGCRDAAECSALAARPPATGLRSRRALRARRSQGRSQRAVSLRFRPQIQALPRHACRRRLIFPSWMWSRPCFMTARAACW
jgi:preprotein translocase subunit SecA